MSQIADVIEVYKRISKASKRGTGIRLCWAEVAAVMREEAVQQALDTATEEEEPAND